MTTRREIITNGLGLAGIIAAGRAPAAIVRSMVAARSAAMFGGKEDVVVPVEYIVGNVNTYIDTDYKVDTLSGDSISCKFVINSTYHDYTLSGMTFYGSKSPDGFDCGFGRTPSSWWFYLSRGYQEEMGITNGNFGYGLYEVTQIPKGSMLRGSISVDGLSKITMTYLSGLSSATVNCHLFSVNGYESSKTKGVCAMKSFTITNGSRIVVDMIAAKKGNIGGMFDRARNRFFENAGTGFFDFPGRIS